MGWTRRITRILLLAVVAYASVRLGVIFFSSQLKGELDPYLQAVTQDSVTIRWQTRQDRMGIVKYGTDPENLTNTRFEDMATNIHSMVLDKLEPDTLYFYSVGDISGYKPMNPGIDWFRTLPEGDSVKPTRIWVIGNSGIPGKASASVRDAMLEWLKDNPRPKQGYLDLFLSLGNMAYRSGSNAQFHDALFDTYHDVMRNQSLRPVLGDHDARRWTYFRLFDLPEQGEAGGVASGTENYYAIDHANVHIIMLDSQDSSLKGGSKMLQWLQQDLANNTKPWIIAVVHHPPYTKGSYDSDNPKHGKKRMIKVRENVLPILESGGVDLVLSGFSHSYERSYLMDCHYDASNNFDSKRIVSHGMYGQNKEYFKPDKNTAHAGTVYVVAGSSSKVEQSDSFHPAMPIHSKETGSLVIDIDGNKLISRYIDATGTVRDEFSIEKASGIDNKYSGCTRE